MIPVFFDLETRSLADLKQVGGRRYAADPSTEVMSLVCTIDGGVHVWVPSSLGVTLPPDAEIWPDGFDRRPVYVHETPTLPSPIADAVRVGRTFVAHNCDDFDRLVWSTLIDPVPSYWYDTIHGARASGLPASLDQLGERLLGRGKDAAKKLIAPLFSSKKRIQAGRYAMLIRYNLADVLLLERVYDEVHEVEETDVVHAHRRVNDRGVRVDLDLVARIRDLSTTCVERSEDAVARLAGSSLNIRSQPQMMSWLADRGVHLPDLRRETVLRFLDDPSEFESTGAVDPIAFDVLRLRNAALRITGAKLERVLDSTCPDGRLRDLFVYYGAHTGRWASRRVQVHNLTRGVGGVDVERLLSTPLTYDDVERASVDAGCMVDDVLSTLIRPCFVGDLQIADYASIEARGVAWCAGETSLLDVFASDGDPYVSFASVVFGVDEGAVTKAQRQVGKVGVLGCGYGMSGSKLALYAANMGIDFDAVGVTADDVVEMYRSAYPRIAGSPAGEVDGKVFRRRGLWHNYEHAAFNAVQHGAVTSAGRCVFAMQGRHLTVRLPSGRHLYYRNARIEDRVPMYCALLGIPERPKPTLLYDSPRGERNLYGGKITENIVQAICRDLLAASLVRVDGVVLHVHDEIVTDGGSLTRLVETMSVPPEWADGFPIKVEGYDGPRYTKSPMSGATVVSAIGGVICG